MLERFEVSPEVAAAISTCSVESGHAMYRAIQSALDSDRSTTACLEEAGACAAVVAAQLALKSAVRRDIWNAVMTERDRCARAVRLATPRTEIEDALATIMDVSTAPLS